MVCNLLLLRGNIGKPGAGPCPVRGHSNVQGQRTVGITEKPELAPLDKLAEQFGFEPPREKGRNTVEACEGILSGEVRGIRRPGRQFRARHSRHRPDGRGVAAPAPFGADRDQAQPQPPGARARSRYLLPCLSRIERDVQASGPQTVTMEDSTSVHPSLVRRRRAEQRGSAVGNEDRGRAGEGDAGAQSKARLDGMDGRLRASPRRDRGDLPAMVQRLQCQA